MHAFWHGLGHSLSSLLLVYNYPTPCRPSSPFFTLSLFFCLLFLFCCAVAHSPMLFTFCLLCSIVIMYMYCRPSFSPSPFQWRKFPRWQPATALPAKWICAAPPPHTLCHVAHKEEMAAILKQLALNCHAPFLRSPLDPLFDLYYHFF